ncbi:MAG: hypothetical protein QY327_05810 [Fimbriimonadaceae bacterium]|nr:ThuA domain-containing protein [Fimbriimonadaceae bacterium]RIK01100.1 MAG: hypothetical protein DCC46_03150 [Armatimonadota bacterium]WKZ81411.1 MAG: hypothetical protein QY327_05810 [Fimbriimonadaceae bacterium]
MVALLLSAALLSGSPRQESLVYVGNSGPGLGKNIVFLAGDEEYRSEEGLPQLARILAFRHGFRCTVLFSQAKDGTIDPEVQDNQPGMEALDSADLCFLQLRFRRWPDSQMKRFDDYVRRGKPLVALRTSTHAFDFTGGPYERYGWRSTTWPGGFGRAILGETWVSHWGAHGKQATRGIPVGNHPVLNGVGAMFGPSDVYEAHPPADAKVLVRGQVLEGMSPTSPSSTARKTPSRGTEQAVNNPMMPVVWVREVEQGLGLRTWALTCTMGAAQDLLDDHLRRLLINSAYYALGLEVPAHADVSFVGEYAPSPFGFGGFKKGVRPSNLAWPKSLAILGMSPYIVGP